jgi:deazaflavin-dependent oxidoreductase (nitroreductase family)
MSSQRLPQWLKPVNKLLIALHRLGIPTGEPVVLTVPGRKSGQPRSTPITPFELRDQLYGVPGFPGSDWVRNARASGTGTLTRGRKSRRVRIVELNAEETRPVLRVYPEKVPVGVAFAKRSGLVKKGTPDEFEALAGVAPVFRFEPIDSYAVTHTEQPGAVTNTEQPGRF